MTESQAKKRFSGFTRWHNHLVEDKYKCSKSVLWQIYGEEFMNTGCIELEKYETKDGRNYIWS